MKVGIDIIEVSRFDEILQDKSKLEKIFTQKEIDYFDKFQFKSLHVAGTFSAKEAFVKALKVVFNKDLTPLDVEILHQENGSPYVNLNNEKIKKSLLNKNVDISISHSNTTATAICVIF